MNNSNNTPHASTANNTNLIKDKFYASTMTDKIRSLKSEGLVVLNQIIDENIITDARKLILKNRDLLKNTRQTASSGHLAGFHRFPALEPLHTILSCNSIIMQFLESVLAGEKLRNIGLSDITVNRSQEWHNDLLRGKYEKHLNENIWEPNAGGVFKILLYLQNSESLKYIKSSHIKPISLSDDSLAQPSRNQEVSSIAVHTGDIVIMDIRCSHRGVDESFYANGQHDKNPKILISTVLGGINRELTRSMEIGNFYRLMDWDRR